MSRVSIVLGVVLTTVVLLLAGCAGGNSVDPAKAAEANANVGADFLRKGANDRAQQAFMKALGYDSDNFTANWGMAVVSTRLGKPKQARRYFRKTLAIRPEPTIYNSYAAFLCQQGETRQGVQYFQKAMKSKDPVARAASMANAGLCLYRDNQPGKATGYFRSALKIDPKQATALTSLAGIAYREQHYMSARAFIERADAAAKLDPDQLLLASKIETALGDPKAAASYRKRYNNAKTQALSR